MQEEVFMPQSILRPCLVLLILLSGTGCAGLGKTPSPPQVTLANIRVQEVKLFETVFQVQMRVFNTSDATLALEGIEADLDLNGKHFARGISRSTARIAPYGTELVTVDVYSSAMNMIGALLDVLEDRSTPREQLDKVGYRLRGKLHLGGLGTPSALPFVSEGRLGTPDFSPTGSVLIPEH
jgi:LEA14-like dessication related protein